ncbi:FxsA family protein [Corynebacterium sp.]|uniref:FxsA family protein n=1 Tax=Corynebacterium sp. TaxID=1720 RepID=UPI0026DC974C|nr:FxsA family protein [Corynebacterium sp.]MDO5031602.1 FxsA family protein [Corynebacterium sp.]
MPFVLFFAYIFLETLAFWAVANWIGVLWAVLALFITMFFGMSIAGLEVRRIMSRGVTQTAEGVYVVTDPTPGKTAGNVGLTMVGGILLSLPGFVSTIVGLLLIFAPTRALIRAILAASLYRKIENMGVRIFEASPMAQHRDNYGSFGSSAAQPGGADGDLVIDEEEIRRWSDSVRPEDFGDGQK